MYLFLFALFSFSHSVLAQEPAFDIDSQIKSIRYDCITSKSRANAKLLTESVITESMSQFASLNPKIRERLLRRLGERSLKITCVDEDVLERLDADSISNDRLFGPYQIRIKLNLVRKPTLILSQYTLLHELLHFAKIDNFTIKSHNHALLNGMGTEDNVYSCANAIYPTNLFNLDLDQSNATCKRALGNIPQE